MPSAPQEGCCCQRASLSRATTSWAHPARWSLHRSNAPTSRSAPTTPAITSCSSTVSTNPWRFGKPRRPPAQIFQQVQPRVAGSGTQCTCALGQGAGTNGCPAHTNQLIQRRGEVPAEAESYFTVLCFLQLTPRASRGSLKLNWSKPKCGFLIGQIPRVEVPWGGGGGSKAMPKIAMP